MTFNRRFAIALFVALALHAGLIAAFTRVDLKPNLSIPSDRTITVTLSTGTTTRTVESQVLATHAQLGKAAFSRQGHERYKQKGSQTRSSGQVMPGEVKHVQQIDTSGKERLATRKRFSAPKNQTSVTTNRSRLTRSAHKDPRAAYLAHWRKQVVHYGNQNYPSDLIDQAPRHRLTLVVTLLADGSIASIETRRSSGSRALDQAARTIVRNAGPYKAFPPNLRTHYSRLTFAYDWVFGG